MTPKQAERLAAQVQKDDPRCRVTGFHHFNTRVYVDVVDTRTGYSFTLYSALDWKERKEAAHA